MDEGISTVLSQERAFRVLMIYFMNRFDKILGYRIPSFIKAELSGCYLSKGKLGMEIHFNWRTELFRSKGNAEGIVEAKVERRNTGSFVAFSFNFAKECRWIKIIFGGFFIFLNGLMGCLHITNPTDLGVTLALTAVLNIFLLILLAIAIFNTWSNISMTKRGFIEEFKNQLKR